MNRGEHTTTKFGLVQHGAGARAGGASGLLSRLLVVLFAAAFSLAPTATTIAQQPAQTSTRARNAAVASAAGAGALRPFRVNVPEAELADLRNYLTQPFVFARPGVEAHEIAPGPKTGRRGGASR